MSLVDNTLSLFKAFKIGRYFYLPLYFHTSLLFTGENHD